MTSARIRTPSIIDECHINKFQIRNSDIFIAATANKSKTASAMCGNKKAGSREPGGFFSKLYTVRTRMKTNVTVLLQLSLTPGSFDDNFMADTVKTGLFLNFMQPAFLYGYRDRTSTSTGV